MNWINTPLKLTLLLALGMALGSGQAFASDTATSPQNKPIVVQLETIDEATSTLAIEPIRLAWDRVGAMA